MSETKLKFTTELAAFNGIQVISSPHATREKWNFPQSKYRSKRLIKKLLKRYGVQVERIPAMYRIQHGGCDAIVAHPDYIKAIKDRLQEKIESEIADKLGVKPAAPATLTPFKLRQLGLMGGVITNPGA
jgi:hypothetical protein